MMTRSDCNVMYEETKKLKFTGIESWQELETFAKLGVDLVEEIGRTLYDNDLKLILEYCESRPNSSRDFEIMQEKLYSAFMNMNRFIKQ